MVEERRLITILFADLSGFTKVSHSLDPVALPPVVVKGIEEPIRVYKPLKIKDKPDPKRGIKGLYSPLVGREREFNLLKERVLDLEKGRGGAVFILGEAGLGKSRLYEELKRYLFTSHFLPTILEARCLSYSETTPYWPFLQILEHIFGIFDSDSPEIIQEKLLKKGKDIFPDEYKEIIPYIGYLFSVHFSDELDEKVKYLDPEGLKIQIFVSVRKLLSRLSRKNPIILVIDDYHWIDSSSLRLLEFIFDAPGSALLFIGLSRPEKDKPCFKVKERLKEKLGGDYLEIVLRPFDKSLSSQLAYNLLKSLDIPGEFVDKILSKAGGNPFYLEEIIRSLIDNGDLFYDAGVWRLSSNVYSLSIPDTIQAVITSRIDRLDPDTQNVLRMASVIGASFNKRILEYISGIDDLKLSLYLAALEEFEYIHKISTFKDEIEYTFKHPLERAEIFILRCWIYRIKGEIEEAIKAGETGLNILSTDLILGSVPQSEINKIRAKGFNNLGLIFFTKGEFDKAIELFEKSLKISEEIGDKQGIGKVSNNLGNVYFYKGEYNKGIELFQKYLKISEEIRDKRGIGMANIYLGVLFLEIGEFEKAKNFLSSAEKFFKEIGEKSGLVYVFTSIAELKIKIKGREFVKEALYYVDEALRLAQELDSKQWIGLCYLTYGKVLKDLKVDELEGFGVKEFWKGESVLSVAEGYFKQAITIFEELKQPFELAKAYYYYG